MIYGEGQASEKLTSILYQRFVQGLLGTDAEVTDSLMWWEAVQEADGVPRGDGISSVLESELKVQERTAEEREGGIKAEQRDERGALLREQNSWFCVVRGEDKE